jgi:hypothetical protein
VELITGSEIVMGRVVEDKFVVCLDAGINRWVTRVVALADRDVP